MWQRALAATYGVVVYVAFLATFLYAIGFVEGLVVPKGIDDGNETAVGVALAINLAVLGVFASQHSVMARPWFKRWWTRFVPQPIERTTYVLFASAALALVMWQWRPLPDVVWSIEAQPWRGLVYGVSFLGWGIVLSATFMIDHFDLFGLKQVARHLRGRAQVSPRFQTPLLYRVVRHPLMLGFLIAFWAAPTMTVGHLLFAGVTTAYILVALQLEERDLVASIGRPYLDYRQRVRGLVPVPRRQRPAAGGPGAAEADVEAVSAPTRPRSPAGPA